MIHTTIENLAPHTLYYFSLKNLVSFYQYVGMLVITIGVTSVGNNYLSDH